MNWRGWLFALLLSVFGVVNAEVVDLSLPFTCPDVSPTPMRINEKGLVMGGGIYPLVNPNTSLNPAITNTVFGDNDGLIEVDVIQYESGKVDVSYMRFRVNPAYVTGDQDDNKIFEKASYGTIEGASYFHSKNQGCKN